MKADLKKLDRYRASQGEIRMLTVPPAHYLMVDGTGDPNTAAEYREALEALYPLSYAIKFISKADGADYVVPPLEGLWWAGDYASFSSRRNKGDWRWTLMIALPEFVTAATVNQGFEAVRAKNQVPLAMDRIRMEGLDEGLCFQTLHVGPYDEEGPSIEKIHDRIAAEGLRPAGKHHEIYLSDPRRVDPDRLKTILRQPAGQSDAVN